MATKKTRITKQSTANKVSGKTVAKKPTKKVVPRKTVAKSKKTVRKVVKPKNNPKATIKKTTSTKKTNLEQNVVKLPTNASLRSIEKAKVISQNLDEYISLCVYRVASTAAICFLLVGTTLVATETFESTQIQKVTNSAQLLGSDVDNLLIDNSPNQTAVEKIEFNLLTDIPGSISQDFNVSFGTRNVSEVEVRIYKSGRTEYKTLSTTKLADGKFRSLIQVDELESGFYKLEFKLFSFNSNQATTRYSPEFQVKSAKLANELDPRTLEDEITSEESEDLVKITDEDGGQNEIIRTDDLSDDVVKPGVEEDNKETFGLEETNLIKTTEPLDEKDILEEKTNTNFILKVTNKDLPYLDLSIEAAADTRFVEIYARPLNSLREQFITLATKRNNNWLATVDTRNLPNGRYEIYARTLISGRSYTSKGEIVEVSNLALSQKEREFENVLPVNNETINDSSDDTKTEKEISISDSESASDTVREFASSTVEVSFLDNQARQKSLSLLSENADSFDELIRRYSVAVQSENELLIQEATNNLNSYRDEKIRQVIADPELDILVSNIEAELTNELESLQSKVRVFEDLRRSRSDGRSAIDTDGDGISDFDEINIYKTDPNSPDTDQDGIPDGVEIMNGFNPNSSEAEAIIEFSSPKETVGLVRPDVLEVESVVPVLPISDDDLTSPVKAEIRGKALPNSFVTIYIFSSPIVVTVKTDIDGSFVYILDKELADGEHDVFVAVTDNTGSIIAQSNPFSFIKEANAFTSVNAEGNQGQVVTSIIETESSDPTIVIGMSIISFGLILLMLGMSVRTNREEEVVTDVTVDAKQSVENN